MLYTVYRYLKHSQYKGDIILETMLYTVNRYLKHSQYKGDIILETMLYTVYIYLKPFSSFNDIKFNIMKLHQPQYSQNINNRKLISPLFTVPIICASYHKVKSST